MKTRLGFVSNSSSSSFVIMGYQLDILEIKELAQKVSPSKCEELRETCKSNKAYDLDGMFYDCLYDGSLFEGVTYLSNDGEGYLGIELCGTDGDYLEQSKNSMAELWKMAEGLQSKLGLNKAPFLYTGTRPC